MWFQVKAGTAQPPCDPHPTTHHSPFVIGLYESVERRGGGRGVLGCTSLGVRPYILGTDFVCRTR